MPKHLLDETAEFVMPRPARHAAEDDQPLEPTQRFDPGFRESRPTPPVPGASTPR
ncbi:hypothetical protein [Blastococcus sp. SYSU D00820]